MAELNISELLGSWALIEWRIEYSEGRPASWPFGTDARGLLMYAPDGWMSATMTKVDRSALTAGSAMKADDDSKAKSFGEYLAYCGTYRIEGSTIVHDVVMSMNPILIGLPHVREAKIENGGLTLRANEPGPNGTVRIHHILWRRP
ncbi:MAG: lipocalin-like domain-containing protein [Vicinamibacteria bacterium]